MDCCVGKREVVEGGGRWMIVRDCMDVRWSSGLQSW